MPSVIVKEAVSKRILKSPLRLVGGTISTTGAVFKSLGHGLAHVGDKVALGRAKEWLPEADVAFDRKGKAYKVTAGEGEVVREARKEVKVFDEKGRRLWGDEDSVASTDGGSVVSEKEFA